LSNSEKDAINPHAIYQKPDLSGIDKLFNSKSSELGKIPVTSHLLQGGMGRGDSQNPSKAEDGVRCALPILRLKFCVMPYE